MHFGYHFWVTVTLTSDLVFRIFVSVSISHIFFSRNPIFGVCMHLGMTKCCIPSLGHCDLDIDLGPSFCIQSGAYLLYSFKLGIPIGV